MAETSKKQYLGWRNVPKKSKVYKRVNKICDT